MTVRWKPLLILSGLFVMVALGGLVAFTMLRGPGGTQAIVARARAERKVRRFGEAEVEYRRALQIDPRAADVHEELASLYEEWGRSAPADRAAKLEAERRARLADAARFGPTLAGPRRVLLGDALDRDDAVEAIRLANEVLKLDAQDATAHFVVAAHMLEETSPNLAEVRRHLAIVAKAEPRPARAEWLAARVAQVAGEEPEMKRVIERSRSIASLNGLAAVDALAVFRLRTMDVQTNADPATLAGRVRAVIAAAEEMAAADAMPTARISRIGRGLEAVQQALDRAKGSGDAKELATLAESVETVTESVFRKATESKAGADLGVFFAYADHYRFRDDREKCLAVIEKAFASPAAARQAGTDAALSLHALAVHAILTGGEDPSRLDRVAPHIKPLLDGTNPRFRAFGHMYQGQVDLERFNAAPAAESEATTAAAAKARSSALTHLKTAANDLPDIAEAQARYGVALILGRRDGPGPASISRRPRSSATSSRDTRSGPRGRWCRGVIPSTPSRSSATCSRASARADCPRRWPASSTWSPPRSTRRSGAPEELAKAVEAYQKAFVNGQKPTAAVQLRLAQIELMLNRPENALARLGAMEPRGDGQARTPRSSPRRSSDARASPTRPAPASPPRGRSTPGTPSSSPWRPQNLVADRKPDEADRLLARLPRVGPRERLAGRAAGLDPLRVAEPARRGSRAALRRGRAVRSLVAAGPGSRRSTFAGAISRRSPRPMAKVRNRWKEAAVGDMLDAQLALARGNGRLASSYYDGGAEEGPGQQGRPVLEGPARRRERPEGRRQGARDRSPERAPSRRSTTASRS